MAADAVAASSDGSNRHHFHITAAFGRGSNGSGFRMVVMRRHAEADSSRIGPPQRSSSRQAQRASVD